MDEWQPVLASLARLRATWPGAAWTWDGRFATVASAFPMDVEPAARASAMLAFPRGWTAKTLEAAPPELRALAERTGGLRARQRLLAGDEHAGRRLYGLWWPWGDDATITLRIGFAGLGADDDPLPRVRDLFGAVK